MNLYMPLGMAYQEAAQSFASIFQFNFESLVRPDFASKSVKPSDRQ